MLARPHAHLSNRARVRAAVDRKLVFKSVLQNPFQIDWPSIPANVQDVLLARLVAALENAPHAFRKVAQKAPSNRSIPEDQALTTSPLVIGINVVTRALESQLAASRKSVTVNDPFQNHVHMPPSPIQTIFVCYVDVDPPALLAHIPYLVAGCNSPRNATQPIKLVPLPKGSEPIIAQTLGVRRAAVVAFHHESPLSKTLQDILDSVPILSASWLSPSDSQNSLLVPTHVKQLRTTAPKDMKCAREQRSRARAAAKKHASGSSRSVRRRSRLTLTTRSESAT